MNNWQLLLAGTAAGTVKGDLVVAHNRKLSFALAGPAQVSFDLPGDHPQAAQMAELATDLYVTCNGEWMFKGRVGASTDNLTAVDHTASFTATDYRGMLDRRIVWPTSTVAYNNLEQAEIAWQLIAETQLLSDLGIWRVDLGGTDTLVPTGVTRTMRFNPGQKVSEAIQLMAQTQGGFDWDVSGQGQFRLFYPRRDRYASGGSPTLAYGAEVVACQRQLASATFANAIYMTGSAGTTLPVSVVGGDTVTYGRFETAIGNTAITDQTTLGLAADLELLADDALTATYSFTLAPGAFSPDLVWLGDSVHFFVAAGRLVVDLVKRVTGVDIVLDDGGGETVTLNIGQNPAWVTAAAGAGGGSAGVAAIASPTVPKIAPVSTGLVTPGAYSLPNTLNNLANKTNALAVSAGTPGGGGQPSPGGFYLRAFTHTVAAGATYYIAWNPAAMYPAGAATLDSTGTIITLPQQNTVYGYRINVRNMSVSNAAFQIQVYVNGDFSQDTVATNAIGVGINNTVAMWHGYMVGNDFQTSGPLTISVAVINNTPGGTAIPIDAGIDITALGQAWSPSTGGAAGPPNPSIGSPVGGMAAWYDASAIKGVPDGAGLATWPDGSANHFDLTVASGATSPIMRSSGGSMIGHKPVVDFGTVDSHMVGPTGVKDNSPVTIFAVAKVTSTPADNWMAGYAAGALPDGPSVGITGGNYEARDGTNTAFWAGADTNAHVITGVITQAAGQNIVLRVDGTQRAITAASGPAYPPAQLLIGGAPTISGLPPHQRNLNGVIGEILIYQGISLSVGQWQQNEAYLKQKWGTP